MDRAASVWQDVQRIRGQAPLVHNITNYVVMNTTANALLAIGASPVMAHAVEEVEEMVGMASALVLNIGTLSGPWIDAMLKAGRAAKERKIPIVLDPVGCGATRYRTEAAQKFVEERIPTIIRGNASEIKALLGGSARTKGVDSRNTPDEVAEDASVLSASAKCVVSVSGPVDVVIENNAALRIANGHPIMTRVTGMGCTASALTGAFAAVNANAFEASAHAMAVMGVAGEMAAAAAAGPGSFQMQFLDALSALQESDIARRLSMQ